MHELSLCKDLIEMVEETFRCSDATAVKAVNVRLGAFSHLQPSALQFCFDVVAQGTLVSGATLAIEVTPALGKCRYCGNRQSVSERFEACCQCGRFPIEVEQADEMTLASIEVV